MEDCIERKIAEKADEVEQIIREMLPDDTGYAKTVYDAMNYSIMAGGKRLRPMLMREFFKLFGGSDDRALKHFMTAMELIHSYSLVHDDLPALDDDDMRRGRESTHKKFGEAMGILTGDALLNGAYEQMSTALSEIDDPDLLKRAVIAFDKIAVLAGVRGMIGGQVVDVENTGKFIDSDMLMYVYQGKTGALLAASMSAGASLGGADDEAIKLVEKIGYDIGMAFQIRDDILDVIGDEEKLGKPVHSDEELDKSTYVAIHGVDESEKAVLDYTDSAVKALDLLPVSQTGVETKEFLKGLFIYMAKRDH